MGAEASGRRPGTPSGLIPAPDHMIREKERMRLTLIPAMPCGNSIAIGLFRAPGSGERANWRARQATHLTSESFEDGHDNLSEAADFPKADNLLKTKPPKGAFSDTKAENTLKTNHLSKNAWATTKCPVDKPFPALFPPPNNPQI